MNAWFRERRSDAAIAALLVVATFAVYAGALHGGFLLNWDDGLYVVNNPAAHGFSWPHVRDAFSQFYVGNYAPVQILSYMLDYTLWGENPAGYLFANVLIHAVNGVLFYGLCVRLTGRRSVGAIASLLFLLHPVQVESVAWISQRKNVLAMLFFLASLLGYLRWRQGRPGRTWWYAASCLLYALALLSKSVAVVLPVVLLLYDFCFLDRERRRGWLIDKVPYLVLTAAVVAVTLKSQGEVISEGTALFATSSRLGKFYTMLTVLARYLALLFRPTGLSAIYQVPVRFRLDGAVAWSGVLAACLVALGGYLFIRRRELFFWYALFFVGLLPVSQIVNIVTLMNDRYLYFPMLGAAGFFACALHPALAAKKRPVAAVAAGILCLVFIPLPWLSARRTAVWGSDLALWSDVVAKSPDATLAWLGLGMSSYDAGRKDEALRAYRRALDIDPNYQFALNNLGALLDEMGRPDAAHPHLVRLVQLFPDYFEGHLNLARNYYLLGQFKAAADEARAALNLQPGMPQALVLLGDSCLGMKDVGGAIRSFREAIANGGPNPELERRIAALEAGTASPSAP